MWPKGRIVRVRGGWAPLDCPRHLVDFKRFRRWVLVDDLAGCEFGLLMVLGKEPGWRKRWRCRCACGAVVVLPRHQIVRRKSCGCRGRQAATFDPETEAVWRACRYGEVWE